jgi:RNA polymerase sigma-70 factor (ECF subfamily)
MTKTYDFSFNRSPGTVVNERKLILQSQQGDGESFACLFDAYLERIHRYVYFRVQDAELAEDITSLVFLKAWEKLGSFQNGPSPFAGWLYRIARNAVVDHYRTAKKVISLEDVDLLKLGYSDEVDEKLEMKVRSQELSEALNELTRTQQEVLILRFVLGFTTPEIASRLQKPVGAIRAVQMRGLKRLATILPTWETSYPDGS